MDQNIEVKHDPKGLGQPPPYTPSDAPSNATEAATNTFTPVQIAQPTPLAPSHITHTGGLYHVHVDPVILPMLIGNQMGKNPITLTCPSCKQVIVTTIKARNNLGTHMGAIVFALFCLWPCVVVPYCCDACRNRDHHCPKCDAYIGSYIR